MTLLRTEQMSAASLGLDVLPDIDALSLLYDSHLAAVVAARSVLPDLIVATQCMVQSLKKGGRLIYVGAGSSGLVAMADGLEIPGTFGVPKEQIVILVSEGVEDIYKFAAPLEDDGTKGARDVAELDVNANDCAIVVSANGATPYCLAALEMARAKGAQTIGLANNEECPLLQVADVAIYLKTLPEVIAGSTRLGAATAQKTALNMMSTLAGIRLGNVHDGHMVNVQVDNKKLQKRAVRIISEIAECDEELALNSLARANNSVKCAILIAKGVPDVEKARELLDAHDDKVRNALLYVSDVNNSSQRVV